MDPFVVGVVTNIGMISLLALSAYLLLLVGEVSFGQQAFFGIGAYASGMATAMWGSSFITALVFGALMGALAQWLVALPTLRLRGFYFSVATLAFAEGMRVLFGLFRFQREVGGRLIGPDGQNGFRNVRYIYDHGLGGTDYMLLVWGLVVLALIAFAWLEFSRFGPRLRMIGEDDVMASLNGINLTRYKLVTAVAAGALAGLAGALYIHSVTYAEPGVFGVMLGVHALAYGLIGGLGTALGPLLGVLIDIGFLESLQSLAQYRMIIFGGVVVIMLIVRPRGLLDEVLVNRMVRLARRRP